MPIPWDEAAPADSDAYSQTAANLRSLKSTVATAVSQSMEWPGSGGGSLASAGQMKLGTFRAYFAAQSKLSNPSLGTTGRLFVASDESRLFGLNAPSSTSTMLLGSARVLEGVAWPGQLARWVYSSGTTEGTHATLGLSLGTTYSVSPVVALSIYSTSQDTAATVYLGAKPTTSAFSFNLRNVGGAINPAETVIHWMSVGTVNF